MKKTSKGFYLVCEEILPGAIKKTIRVKEMLKRGEARTINEAVEKMSLSRSAYYKYKDYVFPFYEASQNKLITLTFFLENKKGVLSSILNMISDASGNVLTIHQGIPLQGVANTTISIETDKLSTNLEALLEKLRSLGGVKKLEILGQE
ncbi:MAG: ACT domain-containing protein [Selenomonadaceae bacterium]|nr:ACT domain-containing protein [Selenomonadaceae bacterium]